MSKQETKQQDKVQGQQGQQGEQKQKRERVAGMFVPYFLAQKLNHTRGLTAERLMVYCWIYAHNEKTGKGQSVPYGKPNYRIMHDQMKEELGIMTPGDLCRKLEEMKWIKKSPAEALNGHKMVGYLCLIDKEGRQAAKIGEQQVLQPVEGEPVVVESSARGRKDYGEMYQFGRRFYVGEDGVEHEVPKLAPPRPSATAVWDNDTEAWYEPEDLPEIQSEF